MSVYGTPAPKRHHINIQGISPPSKRSSIGHKKANVTIRARRTSTDTGGQQIAQSIMNQIVNLTPLEQKHPMLENATVGAFIKFKPAFENYKALRGSKPLADLISIQAKNFLCVLYDKTLTDFSIVDDDTLMHMLEGHFQVLDTNDYIAKLQAVYMVPSEQVDIQKVQLYAQFFLIFCAIIQHTRILLQVGAQQNR